MCPSVIKRAHLSHTWSRSPISHQSWCALWVEQSVHAWSGSGSPPCVQGRVMSHLLQEADCWRHYASHTTARHVSLQLLAVPVGTQTAAAVTDEIDRNFLAPDPLGKDRPHEYTVLMPRPGLLGLLIYHWPQIWRCRGREAEASMSHAHNAFPAGGVPLQLHACMHA